MTFLQVDWLKLWDAVYEDCVNGLFLGLCVALRVRSGFEPVVQGFHGLKVSHCDGLNSF